MLKVGADFDGSDYERVFDKARLTGQIKRVYDCMAKGYWRTLQEIAAVAEAPEASVSAQLRHLRKPKFGSHEIRKRTRGDRHHGLWEYQLVLPPREPEQLRLVE